jgi:hypothetical protein
MPDEWRRTVDLNERLTRIEERIVAHERETERRIKDGLEKLDDLRNLFMTACKWAVFWLIALLAIELGRASFPGVIQAIIAHPPV